MGDIPILCQGCGLVFPASGFGLHNQTATFSGLRIVCPRCGYPAELTDATYIADKYGRITITGYAPQNRETVEILQRVLRHVQAGGDENSIIRELEDSNPSLGAIVRSAKNKGGLALVLFIIVFILRNCSVDASVDMNVHFKRANDIINAQPPDAQNQPVNLESRIQAQDNNDKEPQQSRQQRRQQERQSKKKQPPPVQPKPSKGGSPPKGKGGPRKT